MDTAPTSRSLRPRRMSTTSPRPSCARRHPARGRAPRPTTSPPPDSLLGDKGFHPQPRGVTQAPDPAGDFPQRRPEHPGPGQASLCRRAEPCPLPPVQTVPCDGSAEPNSTTPSVPWPVASSAGDASSITDRDYSRADGYNSHHSDTAPAAPVRVKVCTWFHAHRHPGQKPPVNAASSSVIGISPSATRARCRLARAETSGQRHSLDERPPDHLGSQDQHG